MHWFVQFVKTDQESFKYYFWSILASSFRGFIVSCCFLILTFRYSLSRRTRLYIYQYFQIQLHLLVNTFPLREQPWLCLLWLYGCISFIDPRNICKRFSFLVSFFSISGNNLAIFCSNWWYLLQFLKFCSIFGVQSISRWVYQ